MKRRRHRNRWARRFNRQQRSAFTKSFLGLHRNPNKGKLAGVCAGIAECYYKETWLIRCVAITGVLFIPSIVIPAYIILAIVLPTKDQAEIESQDWSEQPEMHQFYHETQDEADGDGGILGTKRRVLREGKRRFDEVELRIRRLESYLTSKRFELDNAFKNL